MMKFYCFLCFIMLPLIAIGQLDTIRGVTITFTPEMGAEIIAEAQLVGGGLITTGEITMQESTVYNMAVTIEDEQGDLTNQILQVASSYQLFYELTEEVVAEQIAYLDMDSLGLPLGLKVRLTSNCTQDGDISGNFVIAFNELDMKSDTSTIQDGETLFRLSWPITVVDDPEAPDCENEEEVIDRVTLTFAPTEGGDTVVAVASDPDGPGPQDLVVEDIELNESAAYQLSIQLENTLEGEDITEVIMEEDEDHLFLFSFDEDLFDDPDGDGNLDNRSDPVNYLDQDENSLPVGFSTMWTTACTMDNNITGTFRTVLKHQPDIKTNISGLNDGGTDLDIMWSVVVVDDPEAPECENEEEVIDRVTLTFAPAEGGDTVVAVASDPDGPGPQDLVVEDIDLIQSTTYQLSIKVENTIEGEDISEEIAEEDEEHQFYFAWTEQLFSDPTGDGNIDSRDGPVNYLDFDENALPVGLSTSWTTVEGMQSGTFRVALKHQPDMKSSSSSFDDGGTDIDIVWNINSIVTSAYESDSPVIRAWPNPATDYLNVRSLDNETLRDAATIFDNLGRIVLEINPLSEPINVSDLSSGTYYIRMMSQPTQISKFVVLD
ncbi:MAG: T9SS type A sorting domain-containing protein [Saprospiraceae bacterium]|nr:T9SS type A sorting domain-containing protein [Saprospiraceae bacterium]